jgi:hypothetical protein
MDPPHSGATGGTPMSPKHLDGDAVIAG